ncbi:MAG: methane monooxygenase/ammonia monooxygenase subunit A [Burkholderiaceae bacterium]|nr:methane monooxygenase/ammonia monooxygenase subunit A [Burkholderiaceae bacterium]
MTANDQAVLDVAEMSPKIAKWSRTFDYLIVVVAAFLVWSVTHIHFLLLAGDWDFFIDWKDRQYWVLITPVVTIMMAAAFQAIFWHLFRLPIGATASLLLFLIGVWIVRYHSWQGMAHFPLSLVVPATCLIGALALDAILVLTRSWVLTGVFGGALYGLLFFPSNWVYLAPYFQPVEHMGQMSSIADLIGYTFPRSGTPEYIRIIERGTLRTFQDSANWVSAFFAAFICIFMYILFWWVAIAACGAKYIPVGSRFKAMFGATATKQGAAA